MPTANRCRRGAALGRATFGGLIVKASSLPSGGSEKCGSLSLDWGSGLIGWYSQ